VTERAPPAHAAVVRMTQPAAAEMDGELKTPRVVRQLREEMRDQWATVSGLHRELDRQEQQMVGKTQRTDLRPKSWEPLRGKRVAEEAQQCWPSVQNRMKLLMAAGAGAVAGRTLAGDFAAEKNGPS
jgi:hypothetical protein